MSPEEFRAAVKAVEEKYDANVFLYSAGIDSSGFGKLVSEVAQRKNEAPRRRGLLILTTNGGLANSAYQIARLMLQTYEEFILFTPSYCKSAGTLIALGAHRLIMDIFSELGPLDVQLLDKDEIGARKSGLLTRSAFEALSNEAFELFSKTMLGIKASSQNLISFKLAADISWRLTGELMSPIFSQMNPDVIGSDYRDLQIATEYGIRLARASKNPKSDTVRRLVSDYPSHDFIIDREEAGTLFDKVDPPTEELYDLVKLISGVTYRQASPGIIMACSSEEDSGDDDQQRAQTDVASDAESSIAPVAESRDSDRRRNKRKRRGADKVAPRPEADEPHARPDGD
ncbi:SDH family Clp fold serine proteinase [Ensifer sp. LBL]|uniref:SDH family Clp fold serine proteinase n=1 Tax=Ensifer sp. LBL TaxID=2991056 RepID=UPI003D24EA3B